jgi:hypothetical protein
MVGLNRIEQINKIRKSKEPRIVIMKKLIYASIVVLASMTIVPSAKADGRFSQPNVNHLNGATAYPNSANSRSATYKFEVHVLRSTLSDLSIDLPHDFGVAEVEVFDQTGRKVEAIASISKDTHKVAIAFSQPVKSGTILDVRFLNSSNRWGSSGIWLFPISSEGRVIEVARIHTYK